MKKNYEELKIWQQQVDLKSVRHESVQMQMERKPLRARCQRWQKQRMRLQEKEKVGSVQGEGCRDKDLPDAEKIFTLRTSADLSLPRLFQSAAHYGPAHVCRPLCLSCWSLTLTGALTSLSFHQAGIFSSLQLADHLWR